MRTKLLASAAVLAALGTGGSQAVYAGHVPRGAPRKHVVIYAPGGDPAHMHLGGVSRTETPLYQLECWAESAVEAVALANAVDAELSGSRGLWGTTFVHGCIRRDRRGPEPREAADGSDHPVFSVQLDYLVGHAI